MKPGEITSKGSIKVSNQYTNIFFFLKESVVVVDICFDFFFMKPLGQNLLAIPNEILGLVPGDCKYFLVSRIASLRIIYAKAKFELNSYPHECFWGLFHSFVIIPLRQGTPLFV
eukprot:snap_masked-scaffold_3-processed-gene-4.1-mRNA-1 protein AED:1.00 eAED:1.00 QI:0/0/0/0/1/1/2/0/113